MYYLYLAFVIFFIIQTLYCIILPTVLSAMTIFQLRAHSLNVLFLMYHDIYPQSFSEIIETTSKNGVVPVAISNVKLFLKTIWCEVEDNFIIYIYKDLQLRSNESREHFHQDGNLVPIPRCGFCFEAAFQL